MLIVGGEETAGSHVSVTAIPLKSQIVAAVSNLASAAGDWQSVSSRGRAHKSSQWRVEWQK